MKRESRAASMAQIALLALPESVPCLLCSAGLMALDEYRHGACVGYGNEGRHLVAKHEYFRLVRLSGMPGIRDGGV